MKILVTGATGTVGGHVARQLSGRGHQIVALVRDPAKADVPLPIVDPADIAAAAVAVLTAADPVPGAYSITGPETLSVRDQIAVVNEMLGRSYTVQEISPAEAAAAVFPPGTPEPVSTSTLETTGPAAAVLSPSDDVRILTGKPARTFAAWVADHARAFA